MIRFTFYPGGFLTAWQELLPTWIADWIRNDFGLSALRVLYRQCRDNVNTVDYLTDTLYNYNTSGFHGKKNGRCESSK